MGIYNFEKRTSFLPFAVRYIESNQENDKLLLNSRDQIFLYNSASSVYTNEEILMTSIFSALNLSEKHPKDDIVFIIDDLYQLEMNSEDTVELLRIFLRKNIRVNCKNPAITPTLFDLKNFIEDLRSPDFLRLKN